MSKASRKLKGSPHRGDLPQRGVNEGGLELIDLETSCPPLAKGSSNSGDISQRDPNNGKSKSIELEPPSPSLLAEAGNKVRTASRKTCERTSTKRKRSGRSGDCKKGFAVMSKWLNYYADEETDEDIEPLINKRTERRKKQKLWKIQLQEALKSEALDD